MIPNLVKQFPSCGKVISGARDNRYWGGKTKFDNMIGKGKRKLRRGKGSCEEEPHAKDHVSVLTFEKRKKRGEMINK